MYFVQTSHCSSRDKLINWKNCERTFEDIQWLGIWTSQPFICIWFHKMDIELLNVIGWITYEWSQGRVNTRSSSVSLIQNVDSMWLKMGFRREYKEDKQKYVRVYPRLFSTKQTTYDVVNLLSRCNLYVNPNPFLSFTVIGEIAFIDISRFITSNLLQI